jgi:hypothetical protein
MTHEKERVPTPGVLWDCRLCTQWSSDKKKKKRRQTLVGVELLKFLNSKKNISYPPWSNWKGKKITQGFKHYWSHTFEWNTVKYSQSWGNYHPVLEMKKVTFPQKNSLKYQYCNF